MPRARNIKPSLFDNELLGEADPILTVLFIGLWTLADREGKLEDNPKRIRKQLLGYRDCQDINGYLTELEQMEFICRYTCENLSVIKVRNFAKHQSPHKTEKASVLPDIPIDYKGLEKSPEINGTSTVKESLIPDSGYLIPDSGLSDSLIPDSADSQANTASPENDWQSHFEKFWNAFNFKQGKAGALKSWKAIPKSERDLDWIMKSAKAESENRKHLQKGSTPKWAQGWLKEKRWQDEIYTEPIASPIENQAQRLAQRLNPEPKVINE